MLVEKYPQFVGRQQQIDRAVQLAESNGGRTRVLLLDGKGGIGKTWLLQQIEKRLREDHRILCTRLIDMDDTSYHLPSYFNRTIAEDLGTEAFAAYLNVPDFYETEKRRKIDPNTLSEHLTKGVHIFFDAYNRLAEQKRVTILVDTFEEVQDTDFWKFFEQMVRELKNTTFIIAGRRVSELKKRLKEAKADIELLKLAGLKGVEINEFFTGTANLSGEQKRKLALLTDGNPLLLCLALDCYRYGYWLDELDKRSLKEIEKLASSRSDDAKRMRYEFEKSLVVAYADTEPFCYFIRQLAHASRRINKAIFQTLISFRSEDEAELWWIKLQGLPYIRKRASADYISVHDVLRELIFTYVIPVRDPDYSERKQITDKLIVCYEKILGEERRELQKRLVEFDEEVHRQDKLVEQRRPILVDHLPKIVTQIDALESRIWILQAEALHYQLIADLKRGIDSFVRQFDKASAWRQFNLRQRLTAEIKPLLTERLIQAGTEDYFAIGCRLARQEAEAGQAEEAVALVNELLRLYLEPVQQLQLLELRAGCKLKLEHGISRAIDDYKLASRLAQKLELPPVECARLEKQIGWSYRQLGNWDRASHWYKEALTRLTRIQSRDSDTLQELASVYTNAAYIEALRGKFDLAMDFGERGLQNRIALHLKREQGMSYSTLGEIYRYNRNFSKALLYYQQAEGIFYELNDRGWLGRLWQQEAICLLQMGGNPHKAFEKAKQAIDYCVRHNALALPSAYNRAGRIIAAFPDPVLYSEEWFRQSLFYFRMGIEKALEVGDVWFFLATCVEALELVLHEYERTRQSKLLKLINEFDGRITVKLGKTPLQTRKKSKIAFSNLLGRRELVLGTLDYLEGFPDSTNKLESALQHYLQGFQLIAQAFFGSYGLQRLIEELNTLVERVIKLPHRTAQHWRDAFAKRWKYRNIHKALKHFSDRIDELLNINEQAPKRERFRQVA